MKTRNDLVPALLREIDLNHQYLKTHTLDSIYFGGGTPSILTINEIDLLLQKINTYFNFSHEIEITIEANPDDINLKYLRELKNIGINRFSMGVQSFIDAELKILNRIHDSQKAEYAIKLIQDNQFDNMNIDLIFGIPNSSKKDWHFNLEKFIDLDIPHLSCYNLTIESKTAIYHQIKTGKLPHPDDDRNAELFLETLDFLSKYEFEHYEISNYAKNNAFAKHNTNYWKGIPYLGVGPSAHSYDGKSRQWNISNNRKYISEINKGILPYEKEILTSRDIFNEYLLTGLRTMWGIDLNILKNLNFDFYNNIKDELLKFVNEGYVESKGSKLKLTRTGKLIADKITASLFV